MLQIDWDEITAWDVPTLFQFQGFGILRNGDVYSLQGYPVAVIINGERHWYPELHAEIKPRAERLIREWANWAIEQMIQRKMISL